MNEFRDFVGNPINIGDTIVYAQGRSSGIEMFTTEVLGFTPKWLRVKKLPNSCSAKPYSVVSPNHCVVIQPASREDRKSKLRDNLLVTAGIRAGSMDTQACISLPSDVEGEAGTADLIAGAVNNFLECYPEKQCFDLYIEAMLQEEFPAGKRAELCTEKLLVLSTAHIKPETAEKLSKHELDSDLAIYPNEYGAFIHIPDENLDAYDGIPYDLKKCAVYAQDAGCSWIKFDRDGYTAPFLPTHLGKWRRINE